MIKIFYELVKPSHNSLPLGNQSDKKYLGGVWVWDKRSNKYEFNSTQVKDVELTGAAHHWRQ